MQDLVYGATYGVNQGAQYGNQGPLLPAPAIYTGPRSCSLGRFLCCGLLGVAALAAIGIGLGIGLTHHSSNNGGGGSSGGGSSGGGGGSTVPGGVTGGGSNATLANSNLVPVVLSGCPSTDYRGPFDIGDQTFQLVIDSGSSTTAVASSSCSSCNVSPEYSPHGSAVNTGEPAQTQYGDGSGWSGTIFTDTMFGGTSSANDTAKVAMNIVAITAQDNFFKGGSGCGITAGPAQDANQGILGIGPQDLTEPGTDDFVTKLTAVDALPQAYAAQLCDEGGRLWFGGYDPAFVTQDPQYVPMVAISQSNPYYSVNIDAMSVGGTAVGASADLAGTVMDTGTSVLVLPTNVLNAFNSALAENSAFTAAFSQLLDNPNNCVQPANGASRAQLDAALPALTVKLNGGASTDITLSLPATKSYLLPLSSGSTVGAYCLGLADGGNSSPVIFGGGAMRSLMVVFDIANQRMGYAPSQNCATNLS